MAFRQVYSVSSIWISRRGLTISSMMRIPIWYISISTHSEFFYRCGFYNFGWNKRKLIPPSPADCLGIIESFPSRRMSLRCIDLRATPKTRFSAAWALNNATWNWRKITSSRSDDSKLCNKITWSSSGSSLKTGMYFAHSTKKSSCCFIDSQTSLMVAILLLFKS